MKNLIALLACAAFLPLSAAAASDAKKANPAPQRPAASAPAATAPSPAASAAPRAVTSGRQQHQLLARCNQKVQAQGLSGPARKQAMAECLRAS